MATYPIKVLKDESGVPFVPLVSSTGITSPDGTTLEDNLMAKLEVKNIIAGDNIVLATEGNNITITGTASGAANVVIDNLETTTPKQGVLDAHQGYVLNNKITEMAETLEGGIPQVINNLTTVDTINALSAYQGYLLNNRLGVVEEGKQNTIHQIGGYNYFNDPTNMAHDMSGANGIVTSYTDGLWKIVSSSGNGNWLSWAHGNTIEANFAEGDDFVFSIEIRADEGFSGKPTIYFKPGMGYFEMQGQVSTQWSVLYYAGKWKDGGDVQPHLGFGNALGTYYIRKISFERGTIPTNAMKYDIKSASQRTHTNWPVNQNFIPDLTFISNWNGAYDANGGSNLCYCDHGRFGTMATQTIGDFERRYDWTAQTYGNNWCHICHIGCATGVEGMAGILHVTCTRGNVVGNATFLITASHASQGFVTQLGANTYTSFAIRAVANANGDCYVDLYDNGLNASGTYQNWHCCFIPLRTGGVTTYTSYTNGNTIPSGYSSNHHLQVHVGGGGAVQARHIAKQGQNVPATFIQSSTPSATQTGDIWFKV